MSKHNNKNITAMIASAMVALIILLLIINPERYINSVRNGVSLFAVSVLPALFPFFFFTKILSSLGSIQILTNKLKKPVKSIFNMPPEFSFIFFMSILSGYPVGAKLLSEHYGGSINKKNITEISAICSTSGPLFMIGTVGFTLLENKIAGVVIFLSHITAVILFALVYSFISKKIDKKNSSVKNLPKTKAANNDYPNNTSQRLTRDKKDMGLKTYMGIETSTAKNAVYNSNNNSNNKNTIASNIRVTKIKDISDLRSNNLKNTKKINFLELNNNYLPSKNLKANNNLLSESIGSSVLSILTVGGLISIFYMIIDILGDFFVLRIAETVISYILNFLSAPTGIAKGISAGLVEITRGCSLISASDVALRYKTAAACFVITTSGACIAAQSFAFLGKCNINFLKFLLYKLLQAILAAIICFAIFPLFL